MSLLYCSSHKLGVCISGNDTPHGNLRTSAAPCGLRTYGKETTENSSSEYRRESTHTITTSPRLVPRGEVEGHTTHFALRSSILHWCLLSVAHLTSCSDHNGVSKHSLSTKRSIPVLHVLVRSGKFPQPFVSSHPVSQRLQFPDSSNMDSFDVSRINPSFSLRVCLVPPSRVSMDGWCSHTGAGIAVRPTLHKHLLSCRRENRAKIQGVLPRFYHCCFGWRCSYSWAPWVVHRACVSGALHRCRETQSILPHKDDGKVELYNEL